ncbi:MAG: YigZ family protein [Marinagarivorans sp.]|nr:YigZ family protein [Marinagarivorans sp.]
MYQTLSAPASYRLEEKRSEFICHLFPVNSREAALEYLAKLKLEFPDARHYCWAYLIGDPKQPKTAAFNDDGEPAGTAGKPILHVLTQRGAGDCCAIVVRYFGGIKLGAGGLVRAYGQSVSRALDIAIWQEVIPKRTVIIITSYEDEPHARHFIMHFEGEVLVQRYSERVELSVELPSKYVTLLKDALTEKTGGRCRIQEANIKNQDPNINTTPDETSQ